MIVPVIGLHGPHSKNGCEMLSYSYWGCIALIVSNQHLLFALQLSEHKHLTGGVEFIETIPKSASGKILRRKLR